MATVRMTVTFDVEFSEEDVAKGISKLMEWPDAPEGADNMMSTLVPNLGYSLRAGFVAAFLKERPEVAKDFARAKELVNYGYQFTGYHLRQPDLPLKLVREYIRIQLKYSTPGDPKWSWEDLLEKVNREINNQAIPEFPMGT